MKRTGCQVWCIIFPVCCFLLTGCSTPKQPARYLFPAEQTQTLETVYISETGEEVAIPGLEAAALPGTAVEETENGYLYPAKKDGLWGYVSADGEWKIEPQFLSAWPFYEGYAQVLLCSRKNAYIDPWGDIRLQADDGEVLGCFGGGIAIRYQQTDQEMVLLDFLDTQGRVIAAGIPVDKDSLDTGWFDKGWFDTGGYEIEKKTIYFERCCFSEGLLAAGLEGKYGYLNSTGEWVIEPKYEDAKPFSEGRAAVCLNGKYGYIDRSGKEVIPCIYERAQSFSEGLGAVKLDNGNAWDWQFLRPDGSVVFQLEHRCFLAEIGPDTLLFHEGLCCARQQKYWIYYDKTGNPAITIDTWIAKPFQHGLAYIQDNKYACGYIDTQGDRVYEWDWERLVYPAI